MLLNNFFIEFAVVKFHISNMKNKLLPQIMLITIASGPELQAEAFDMSWSFEDILGVISMEIDLDKVFNIDHH